ncbi:MAG: SWIM zinc finger family protein, partial [Kineosporiaceae bacterium]
MSADRTWWGRQWLRSIEQRAQLDPNRLPRARRYARSGAIHDLQIGPGEVRATVAGRGGRPYAVRVRVRPFTDVEWRRVLQAIAARATYAAALLEGDLPPDVGTAVEETGLALVPGPAEIGPRCTCPDDADPCKHSAAVCFLVADTLDADPFVILLLRGRTRDEVLAGLRALRRDRGAVHLDADAAVESAARPSADSNVAKGTIGHEPAQATLEDPGADARDVLSATEWGPVPDPP